MRSKRLFTVPFQLKGETVHMKRAAVEPVYNNGATQHAWLGHKRAHFEQWAQAWAV